MFHLSNAQTLAGDCYTVMMVRKSIYTLSRWRFTYRYACCFRSRIRQRRWQPTALLMLSAVTSRPNTRRDNSTGLCRRNAAVLTGSSFDRWRCSGIICNAWQTAPGHGDVVVKNHLLRLHIIDERITSNNNNNGLCVRKGLFTTHELDWNVVRKLEFWTRTFQRECSQPPNWPSTNRPSFADARDQWTRRVTGST